MAALGDRRLRNGLGRQNEETVNDVRVVGDPLLDLVAVPDTDPARISAKTMPEGHAEITTAGAAESFMGPGLEGGR